MISFSGTPTVVASATSNNQPLATLSATITDSVLTYVGATVNWGDGTTTRYSQVKKPLIISGVIHTYSTLGTYNVTVTAFNYASPTPQTITWTGVPIYANSSDITLPGTFPNYAYIGPIIANALGYPNPNQWAWQFGTDNATLISSLTLLLSTSRGDRLMDPNFGTNLAQLVFSLNGPIVNDAIYSDVQQAVASYEPRAQLVDIKTTVNGRVIFVNAAFQSLINGQQFSVQNVPVVP
jgi:phage baseplate assembly protein W